MRYRLFVVTCVMFLGWWIYTFSGALATGDVVWFFTCLGLLGALQAACWWFVLSLERRRQHSARTVAQSVPRTAHERRRAHKLANGGWHSKAQWEALCRAYGGRCAACGQVAKLTKDHVQPLSLGGSDDITNLQPLCGPCNSRKGARHIDYRKGAKHAPTA